jgi:hypothetical protein
MNHPQIQFARSPVRAASKDRRAATSSRSPATIIDDQTKTRHRAGRPVRGCDASMPAHRERGPEFLLTRVGSPSKRFSLALALPRSTGRELRALGIFSADSRGCRPSVASINDAADHLLNHRSYRFPSHSKISVPFAHEHEAKGVGSDQKAIGVSQNVVDC